MVGMEESVGVVGTSGPGDGKSGAISGGSPCRLEDGGELVKNVGEAEMLEAFELKIANSILIYFHHLCKYIICILMRVNVPNN
ncbi:unnamed protein product [Malus baccata var. baccata]